jgi:signal peptidase I
MGTPLKLAITTIGDLLLHNKFSRDEIGKAIPDINLVIPNYQRPYKWTGKNVIQLLDDIIEAKNENKETYRVGTLILHKNEYQAMTYSKTNHKLMQICLFQFTSDGLAIKRA